MSLLRQKLKRIAAGGGLLGCATVAFLALGSVGAGSASAACTTTIEGRGSSLQRVAQTEVFAPAWAAAGCGTGSNAKVNYVSTSSSNGLGLWGYLGSGTVNTSVPIIGTDAAPTAAQISAARSAGHGANTVIVPVAQTAIAIVVHPPAGCTLTQIRNVALDEAFSGKATTWAAIGGTGTCSGSVTRVVRAEGSGDTYQFKNYLAKIHGWSENEGAAKETAPCTGSARWSELQPITAAGPPNTTWPNCGSIPVTTAVGGGGVAERVVKTEGTIGYAALPDAKAKGAQTASVQDASFGGTKAGYGAPEVGEAANCEKSIYAVPSSTTGLDVDWSQSFGGNPTIGGGLYPICALTFDLGWHSYATAGFGSSAGPQVRNYYGFILWHGLGATPKYYAGLPRNVREAAEIAVGKIN